MNEPILLLTIPGQLTWTVPPISYELVENRLKIVAGAQTDLFNDPRGEYTQANSSRLAFTPEAVFIVQAKVQVDFQATFDAGAFILWADENHWAKLAFEFSPQREPMIVTVITREVSDDCNSMVIAGNEVYLRVAKLVGAYAFHASVDGRSWQLIRYFSSANLENATVNFSAQSPMGGGCTAVFSEIVYTAEALADIRNGT
ncbi:MAG: DUF1349 domain-containing protein [Chloroflexi bacterium]|nr:DUF1349 domain-containing protein [Ardenticatenaceae bacterium]MBL1128556.1 DUF1349 domain-containing protein [Chloroflexota bacterium]NOG34635.1 DUF1349 domain-containing protein [Chloroflexota bacterium]GIK56715.1 MAG: hypothetical protein BroJett015_23780 [Chloroflexota bacterium]